MKLALRLLPVLSATVAANHVACERHGDCTVPEGWPPQFTKSKCKGHRGSGKECRIQGNNCKLYGTGTRRWDCRNALSKGWSCFNPNPNPNSKWGYCVQPGGGGGGGG